MPLNYVHGLTCQYFVTRSGLSGAPSSVFVTDWGLQITFRSDPALAGVWAAPRSLGAGSAPGLAPTSAACCSSC